MKDDIEKLEYEYFDLPEEWEDESCANYVAWILRGKKFNIIVDRVYPNIPGLYDVTKVAPNVRSNSDPWGISPEIWNDKVGGLSLKETKKYIKKLLR